MTNVKILKNQVIEEQLLNLINNSQYINIFYVNSVHTKQWTLLKNIFEKKDLKTKYKIVRMKSFYNSYFNTLEENNSVFSVENENIKTLKGSYCLFFCSTIGEMKTLFEILELNRFSGLSNDKENTKNTPFLFLGTLYMKNFFSIIDIKFLLNLNTSQIFMKIISLLNKNKEIPVLLNSNLKQKVFLCRQNQNKLIQILVSKSSIN